MKIVTAQPSLVVQVRQALVAEIAEGKLKPGERIIQERLAQELGVSRQPVQQALLLLRDQGLLRDAAGRGLVVAPLDPEHVRHMYDIRAAIEGLAFRRAAETNAERAARLGPTVIEHGRRAVSSGSLSEMIAADLSFHDLIHELSRNPLIALTMDAQWSYVQRAMGETLMDEERRHSNWDQHEEMLRAIVDRNGDEAEALARRHVREAAELVIDRLERSFPMRAYGA